MANNLDRLFREGLDTLEVTPQAQSWKQVQSQLANNKKYKGILPLSIAASILIMLTTTIIVFLYSDNQIAKNELLVTTKVDHPTEETMHLIELEALPSITTIHQQPAIAKQDHNLSKPKTAIPAGLQNMVASNETIHASKPRFSTMNIASIHELPSAEIKQLTPALSLPAEATKKSATIKITYIAKGTVENGRSRKLGHLISAFSKEGSGSGILADIRDAKDNLFKKN